MMNKTLLFALFLFIYSGVVFADGIYRVTQVIDGDTIEVNDRQRITLAGIDTPEVYHNRKLYKDAKKHGLDIYDMMGIGSDARHFTRSIVGGRDVRVELDADVKNEYGNKLGYVFVKVCNDQCKVDQTDGHEYVQLDDGVYDFVNATLVKSGYAAALKGGSVKYRDLFKKLENEAKKSQTGLWVSNS